MEYTNYETGKPCSRDEYIQNGLERGELLYKYDCGCLIIQDRTADAYIVYCPRHAAAPEFLKALKVAQTFITEGTKPQREKALIIISQAIAKADNK